MMTQETIKEALQKLACGCCKTSDTYMCKQNYFTCLFCNTLPIDWYDTEGNFIATECAQCEKPDETILRILEIVRNYCWKHTSCRACKLHKPDSFICEFYDHANLWNVERLAEKLAAIEEENANG